MLVYVSIIFYLIPLSFDPPIWSCLLILWSYLCSRFDSMILLVPQIWQVGIQTCIYIYILYIYIYILCISWPISHNISFDHINLSRFPVWFVHRLETTQRRSVSSPTWDRSCLVDLRTFVQFEPIVTLRLRRRGGQPTQLFKGFVVVLKPLFLGE